MGPWCPFRRPGSKVDKGQNKYELLIKPYILLLALCNRFLFCSVLTCPGVLTWLHMEQWETGETWLWNWKLKPSLNFIHTLVSEHSTNFPGSEKAMERLLAWLRCRAATVGTEPSERQVWIRWKCGGLRCKKTHFPGKRAEGFSWKGWKGPPLLSHS